MVTLSFTSRFMFRDSRDALVLFTPDSLSIPPPGGLPVLRSLTHYNVPSGAIPMSPPHPLGAPPLPPPGPCILTFFPHIVLSKQTAFLCHHLPPFPKPLVQSLAPYPESVLNIYFLRFPSLGLIYPLVFLLYRVIPPTRPPHLACIPFPFSFFSSGDQSPFIVSFPLFIPLP